jgi:4-amino-4-deoxy-L-arabinose transferase-like glycosyltransferase
MNRIPALWALSGLWLALLAVSLFSRQTFPVDETRYVAVAWEMWLRGDFLVPYLNGETYSHKPPLLFWLMQLGWAVFGVNDWWPRLVAPLFGLGSLFLTHRLARQLWPDQPAIAEMAAWLVFGIAFWMVFVTVTMFDMLVVFFSLLGLSGVLQARTDRRGWWLLGSAIGLGILAKGPVILLHVLPAAALAGWWNVDKPQPRRHWLGGIALALLLGAAIGLAWAIPAGIHGGTQYQHEIFWGQTAGRVAQSFAHRRAVWWYLALLPLLLFPWLWWPPVWRNLLRIKAHLANSGVRFCLAWLLPVFIAFSIISGKQPQYLLPLFPAFALLLAYLLSQPDAPPLRWHDRLPPAFGILVASGLTAVPDWFPEKMPEWGDHISPLDSWLVMLIGLVLLWRWRMPALAWIKTFTLAVSGAVITLHWIILLDASPFYDMRPPARELARLFDAGIPVAHQGKYHGQFHFAGRLRQPLPVVNADTLPVWIATHPGGRIIRYIDHHELGSVHSADTVFPYRGGYVVFGLK